MAGSGLGPILFREVDSNGEPLAGGLLYAYEVGTTTPLNTYNDPDLADGHENENPIVLDSVGRALVYLLPRAYRFVLTDADGVEIYDVPSYSAFQTAGGTGGVDDDSAVFGEDVVDADWVVVSDGAGGRTPGRWYRGDADDPDLSTLPGRSGFAVGDWSTGDTGTVRLDGTKDGFSGLSAGQVYYGSATVGGVTLTEPDNRRVVGVALSATTMAIVPSGPTLNDVAGHLCQGVLTLASGVAYPPTDQTAKTTIYFTPYQGNVVRLYDGTNWNLFEISELSLALGTLVANRSYDVFVYDNDGTPTLEFSAAWNSATAGTRHAAGIYASLLPTQDGVMVKSTNGTVIDATRMYVGTFYTASTTTTEDSAAKRYLYNYYHRQARSLQSPLETTDSWTYSLLTWRQARASATNQVEFVIGVAESIVKLTCSAIVGTDGAGQITTTGIGLDSTTTLAANCLAAPTNGGASQRWTAVASYVGAPGIGIHSGVWLESSGNAGVTTWYGDNAVPTFYQSGILGSIS